jgi:hypothetical protein
MVSVLKNRRHMYREVEQQNVLAVQLILATGLQPWSGQGGVVLAHSCCTIQ